MEKHSAFMMRLRPEVRRLLDQAAQDQRRTRVSILEELILEAYAKRYATTEARLDKLLGAR
jgi:predicted transcriptional regulator